MYGSETWALKVEHEEKLSRAQMRMIRWMRMRPSMAVEAVVIVDVVRRGRLPWYSLPLLTDT